MYQYSTENPTATLLQIFSLNITFTECEKLVTEELTQPQKQQQQTQTVTKLRLEQPITH